MTATPSTRFSRFLLDWDYRDGLDSNGLPIFRSGEIPSFDRGGTVGTASGIDGNGRLFVPGYKSPVYEHRYNSATGLWEPAGIALRRAATNLVLQPENFGTTWTAVGTPTRSAAAHTASGVTLDLIGDDDGAAQEYFRQTITFTGDATKGIAIHWKAGTSPAAGGSYVQLYDVTSAAERLGATITSNGGAPSVVMAVGTYIGAKRMADGVYCLEFLTSTVTAANTNRLSVFPAVVLAQTGNAYFGGVHAENSDGEGPSAYIPQTTSALTRSADTFDVPFNISAAQLAVTGVSIYEKFVLTAKDILTAGLSIGAPSVGGTNLISTYRAGSSPNFSAKIAASATLSDSTVNPTVAIGDTIERFVTVTPAGVVQISVSVNAGTVAVGAAGPAGGWPTAFGNARAYFTDEVTAARKGGLIRSVVRIAAFVKTMDYMRAG